MTRPLPIWTWWRDFHRFTEGSCSGGQPDPPERLTRSRAKTVAFSGFCLKTKAVAVRDEFDEKTKDILARRVGYRCSNPNCRKLTSGPQEDQSKALNIGVAAHITAASPGGPRYDARFSSDERRTPDNGIWLFQNSAKLVDNDEQRYTTDLLVKWKNLSENAALLEVQNLPVHSAHRDVDDIDLLRFYSACLDRSEFQYPFSVLARRSDGSNPPWCRTRRASILSYP